jgi:hypothetical protein
MWLQPAGQRAGDLAANRRAAASVRLDSVTAFLILGTAACGEIDRCLDRGGRWNDSVDVCEFAPGPLITPGNAISAGMRTLEFAYGSGVLAQAPFLAELNGNVWHVFGATSEGALGGVAHAWIELDTGSVRKVVHDQ